MKRKLVLFVVAYCAWAFLNWVPDWQHLVAGIFVSALVAWMTGDLFIKRTHVLKHPLRYWYFIAYYVPVFLWECFKANIDVAYRVVHPKLPINPGIVKVKMNVKTDTAITFLANSITLTPGTLSVDVNKEKGLLYVHWLDVKATDVETATQMVVERFEKILRKIFE